MIYHYSGELKRADYTLPHMAPNVGGLAVISKPIEYLRLWLIKEEKSVSPGFDGILKFNAWSGSYTKVSAFTKKSWKGIF
ncbi:hypothetical protein CZ787_05940 [Halomonas citrativorans]|uniref:Uncharacterized protein n=1 Tax=Halomonas citrativorans TaxID=2742612 RepID=A0A1R4HV64_9GAMM|nr:hypothetical protein CZ787_05940 [Halomonas citrativorans]